MSAPILIKNIHTLLTMDDDFTVLNNVDLLIENEKIVQINKNITPVQGAELIDAHDKLILPGFVNTHHHLYQTLTRVVPKVQNAKLFDWLVNLYEVWRELTPEAVYVSALTGMAELILTGCTTTSDHFYLFPSSCPDDLLDLTIQAARDIGIRFLATRGAMSRGRSKGGLPPDDVCQSEDAILYDYERVISKFHGADNDMIRIALAPCSPFSVSEKLMRETVNYARKKNVFCHTHLAETIDEENYTLEKYGLRPLELMEKWDWLGSDVWFAHGVHFNDVEIQKLADTKTGIAHCPNSNLRLGSGIARISEMLDQGVRIGIGVDGSASNDSSNMLRELQNTLLIHRIKSGVDSMPKERVYRMAIKGGADLLGFKDIGELKVGKKADIVGFSLDDIGFAGAMHDPAAALLFTGTGQRAQFVIINGRLVVWDKQILTANITENIIKHNKISYSMIEKAKQKTGIDFFKS